MLKGKKPLSRRGFLITNGMALAALALPRRQVLDLSIPIFEDERLGRVVEPRVAIRDRPHADSAVTEFLDQDDVVPWLAERVGVHPNRSNQRWVETQKGYIHSPSLQPVLYEPNKPVETVPETSLGPGMWTEVTIPWVDVILENPPARSPWLKNSATPRLYYSQILWIDKVRKDSDGLVWYRVNERFGFGDLLWADARAFRVLTREEIRPIHPELDDKRVIVNLLDQTLSCFEGGTEVYFCRVSTGVKFDVLGQPSDTWSTPLGPHPVWRKAISMHMVGGTTGGGWDLAGVGWTTLFVGNGVAIHSTFWHNDFGVPRSRGCVNARPDDAKWIFRWLTPLVPYDPGDVTVTMPGGTIIEVVE
jgi:hypothetical protein